MNKKVIIISGFSGAGKGSLVRRLFEIERFEPLNKRLWLSVSDTTRLPRNDGGDNYNYIAPDEYRNRIINNYYLEYNEYGNNGYGTPLNPVLTALEHDDIPVLEIDYNGMAQVREYFRDSSNISVETVFICTEAYELFSRLRKRGDSPTEIKKRLSAACSKANHIEEYDHVINNDILEKAAHDLWVVVTDENTSTRNHFNIQRFCKQMHSILDSFDFLFSV